MAKNLQEYVVQKIINYSGELESLRNEVSSLKENGRIICECFDIWAQSKTRLIFPIQCNQCKVLHDERFIVRCFECSKCFCDCKCLEEGKYWRRSTVFDMKFICKNCVLLSLCK